MLSGSAVGIMAKSSVVQGMRVIGEAESFPALPSVDLGLYRSVGRANAAADAMADLITRHFAQSGIAPRIRKPKTQAGSGSHE